MIASDNILYIIVPKKKKKKKKNGCNSICWGYRRKIGHRAFCYRLSISCLTKVRAVSIYSALSQACSQRVLDFVRVVFCLWSCWWYSRTGSWGANQGRKMSGSGTSKLRRCSLQMKSFCWLFQPVTSSRDWGGLMQRELSQKEMFQIYQSICIPFRWSLNKRVWSFFVEDGEWFCVPDIGQEFVLPLRPQNRKELQLHWVSFVCSQWWRYQPASWCSKVKCWCWHM